MCGTGNIIFHSLGGPVKINTPEFEPVGEHFVSGKAFTWAALVRIPDIRVFIFIFWKQRRCEGRESAQGPVFAFFNEPKKTGAHVRPKPTR